MPKLEISVPPIKLTDYILHRGDTGNGEGVALVWIGESCPIPSIATVAAMPGANRDLLIRGAEYSLILANVEQSCFELALQTGLHVIWQSSPDMQVHQHQLKSEHHSSPHQHDRKG